MHVDGPSQRTRSDHVWAIPYEGLFRMGGYPDRTEKKREKKKEKGKKSRNCTAHPCTLLQVQAATAHSGLPVVYITAPQAAMASATRAPPPRRKHPKSNLITPVPPLYDERSRSTRHPPQPHNAPPPSMFPCLGSIGGNRSDPSRHPYMTHPFQLPFGIIARPPLSLSFSLRSPRRGEPRTRR